MPGELTQAEFYHYYTASQRRVELWVQETHRTLSILEGQGVERQEEIHQVPEKDIVSFLPSPQQTQTQIPISIPPGPDNSKEQEPCGQDVIAGKPSRHSKIHEVTRTSSKHRVHDSSRSRSRPSSGSKKIPSRGLDKHAATTTKASRSSTRPRARSTGRHSSEYTSGLAAYIPYGVLPLLFAVTGASTLSVVAGVILLSGFVFVEMQESPTREVHSRRKTNT